MDFGFFGIGTWELLVIGLIALIILGPRQMIILARKAGELLRQFQSVWREASKTLDRELKAIEEESGDITGLAKDIQALTQNVKSAVTLNLPGNGNPPIIAPPAPRPSQPANNPTVSAPPATPPAQSSAPTLPQPNSESAAPALPAVDLPAPGPAPVNDPTVGAQPPKTYPAWTNKPKN